MPLLIDGYNLLHATDLFGRGTGPGGFQRAREALLSFVANCLDARDRQGSTIVFDAADAPPGLPRRQSFEELTVLYASDYPDADAMIENLLESHPAPRSLLVVSSDHRVQRAARRRGAKNIDSELWYARQWQHRVERRRQLKRIAPEKPMGQLSAAEIEYWVGQFAGDQAELLSLDEKKKSADADFQGDPLDPFPPGYADDLADEFGDLP